VTSTELPVYTDAMPGHCFHRKSRILALRAIRHSVVDPFVCTFLQKVQKHKPKRLGSLEAWRSDKILEAAQQVRVALAVGLELARGVLSLSLLAPLSRRSPPRSITHSGCRPRSRLQSSRSIRSAWWGPSQPCRARSTPSCLGRRRRSGNQAALSQARPRAAPATRCFPELPQHPSAAGTPPEKASPMPPHG